MRGLEFGSNPPGKYIKGPRNYKVDFFYRDDSSAFNSVSESRGTLYNSPGVTKTVHNPGNRSEVYSFRIEQRGHKKSPGGSVRIHVSHTTLHREGMNPLGCHGVEVTLKDNQYCTIGGDDIRIIHADDSNSPSLDRVKVLPGRRKTRTNK